MNAPVALAAVARRLARTLTRHYFRTEIRGLEHLPAGPALLVGNHNAAPVMPDTLAILTHYAFGNPPRQLKVMTHDLTLQVPFINAIATELGSVSSVYDAALKTLAGGYHVLIYPGGGWDSCRPHRDRDRIDFKGRQGYLRLALDAGVPIVPVVSAGAQDGWRVLTRGDRIAELLGLKKYNVDIFPIALALPWGLVVGPAVPFIPLPRKVLVSILPPIDPRELVKETGGHAQAVARLVSLMQAELDRLVQDLPRSRR